MPGKHRKIRGGFSLGDYSNNASNKLSSGWASLSQGASNAYNKTKNAVRPNQSFGGRRRTRRSKRGGSFSAHKPLHGLAAHSSPVSNVRTAQPHHMVGGRSKRHRKHKHSRSCKH